jgi:hypothetical protein
VGKLLPSSVYISGGFRCNTHRKPREVTGIDLVSSRFRPVPDEGTIDLGRTENHSILTGWKIVTQTKYHSWRKYFFRWMFKFGSN